MFEVFVSLWNSEDISNGHYLIFLKLLYLSSAFLSWFSSLSFCMTQFFEFPISNLPTISFFILLPSGFWTHGNHQWRPPNQIQWHCWVPTFSITCYILSWLHPFLNSLSCLGLRDNCFFSSSTCSLILSLSVSSKSSDNRGQRGT